LAQNDRRAMPESQLLPSVLVPNWDELFVSRSVELDLIVSQVDATPERSALRPVLAFQGVSGVGKSALYMSASAQISARLGRGAGLCRLDFDSPRYSAHYPLFELFGKTIYPAVRAAGFRCPLFLVMYAAWAARLKEFSAVTPSTVFQDLLEQGKETSESLGEKDSLFRADWLEVFGEAAEGFGAAKLLLRGAAYLKAHGQRHRFAARFADLELSTLGAAELNELAPKALAADILQQLEGRLCRLTLVIDGFDRLQSDRAERDAEWALQQLLANLVLSPAGERVRCICFSRLPIAWHKYDAPDASPGWPELIDQRELLGFDEYAAAAFLSRVEFWYEQCGAEEGATVAALIRRHKQDLLTASRESDAAPTLHALALRVAVEQVARHRDRFTVDLLGRSATEMYARFLRGLGDAERDLVEVFCIFGEFSEKQFASALRVGLLPGTGSHQFGRVVGERRYCISRAAGAYHRMHSQLVRSTRSWCMSDEPRKASYFRACQLLLTDLLNACAEEAKSSYVRAEEYLESYLLVLQNYALDLEAKNQEWLHTLGDTDMQVPAWMGLELRTSGYLEHARANQRSIHSNPRAAGHFLLAITRAVELMFAIGNYEQCLKTVAFLQEQGFELGEPPKSVWAATLRLHEAVSLIRTSRVREGQANLSALAAHRTEWFQLTIEGVRTAGKLGASLGDFDPVPGLEFIDWLVTTHGEECKSQLGFDIQSFLGSVEARLALKLHDLPRASRALARSDADPDASGTFIDSITEAHLRALRARIALSEGHRDSAIAMASHAVQLVNGIEGARGRAKSQILADAGTVLRDANASQDWLQILRESLRLHEASDGPESHLCVPVRTALAHGLVAQEEFTEAVALLRRNVEVMERDLGAEHMEMAAAFVNLANAIVESGGDDSEAHDLFARAWSVVSAAPNATAFNRGVVLANWGANALERHEFTEAKTRLAEALQLLRKVEGFAEGHLPKVLYNLAGILQMEGDIAAALFHLDEARQFLKRFVGDDAPDLARINDLTIAVLQGHRRRPASRRDGRKP